MRKWNLGERSLILLRRKSELKKRCRRKKKRSSKSWSGNRMGYVLGFRNLEPAEMNQNSRELKKNSLIYKLKDSCISIILLMIKKY